METVTMWMRVPSSVLLSVLDGRLAQAALVAAAPSALPRRRWLSAIAIFVQMRRSGSSSSGAAGRRALSRNSSAHIFGFSHATRVMILIAAAGKAAMACGARGAFDIGVRDDVRQLRGEGDHLVVHRRRWSRKCVLKPAGASSVLDAAEKLDVVVVGRHKHHGRVVEQIAGGVFEAGILRAPPWDGRRDR